MINGGVPQFQVFLGGGYKQAVAAEKLPLHQWSHVAGVFDGEAVSLYVNGSLVAQSEASGQRKRNKLPLFIGADPGSNGQPTRSFTGKIDNVRLSKGVRYSGDAFVPSRGEFSLDADTLLLLDCDRTIASFVPGQKSGGQVSARLVGPKAKLVDGRIED
ncbi:MAG: LamG domain-containing protein [Verrucomicrobiales bacterium]